MLGHFSPWKPMKVSNGMSCPSRDRSSPHSGHFWRKVKSRRNLYVRFKIAPLTPGTHVVRSKRIDLGHPVHVATRDDPTEPPGSDEIPVRQRLFHHPMAIGIQRGKPLR